MLHVYLSPHPLLNVGIPSLQESLEGNHVLVLLPLVVGRRKVSSVCVMGVENNTLDESQTCFKVCFLMLCIDRFVVGKEC